MIYCIAARRCQHYFLPEVNLFETIPEEFLSAVGQRLVDIRRDPIKHLRPLSTDITRYVIQEALSERGTRCSKAIVNLLEKLKPSENPTLAAPPT